METVEGNHVFPLFNNLYEDISMATKANKTNVASIVKAIDNKQSETIGKALGALIITMVASEGAIDKINGLLADAKRAGLAWGDRRSGTGLAHFIGETVKDSPLAKGSIDNWISTMKWCYQEKVRVQYKDCAKQKKMDVQLDLITGEVRKAKDETVIDGAGPDKSRKTRAKTERTAAYWLIKAKGESGYIPILGHFAQLIRILSAEDKKDFDAKTFERLMDEALVKSKLAKLDGNEVKAI